MREDDGEFMSEGTSGGKKSDVSDKSRGFDIRFYISNRYIYIYTYIHIKNIYIPKRYILFITDLQGIINLNEGNNFLE